VDWHDTPVYIISFNNLDRGFRRLVEWLQSADMKNIKVIDNHSTWEPLLRYYETLNGVELLLQPENLGHEVFWRLGYQNHQVGRYIVTDPDVVPAEGCPRDLVRKMHEVSNRYSNAKVGPGIRIDNLPDHYFQKDYMRRCECRYWDESARVGPDCFDAAIDTTFALYEPGAGKWDGKHFRLDFPYVVEHIPWYDDSSKPNPEREFYKATVIPGVSHSE
jgi:hypothetical protein